MVEWFGNVLDGIMKRNEIGEIAHQMWLDITNNHENIILDEFVVMPNHVHGIIAICEKNNCGKAHGRDANGKGRDAINRVSTGGITKTNNPMLSRQSLSYIVRQYKGRVSFEIHKTQPGFTWHSRFYDHIIRNEKGLNAIRKYINDNPSQWEEDRNNPSGLTNWQKLL